VIVFNPTTKKIWDSAVFLTSIVSKDEFSADTNMTHVWNAALYKGNQYAGRTSVEGLSTGIHRTPYIHSSIYPITHNTRICKSEYEQQLMFTNIDSQNSTELYNSYYGSIVFHYIVVHRTPIGHTAVSSKSMIKKKQGMIDKTIPIPKRGVSPAFEHYELICDIHTSVNIMSFRIYRLPYTREMSGPFRSYTNLNKQDKTSDLSGGEQELLLKTVENNTLFVKVYNRFLDKDFTIKEQVLLNKYTQDIALETKEVQDYNEKKIKTQNKLQTEIVNEIIQTPDVRLVINNTSLESENKLRRIFIQKTSQSFIRFCEALDGLRQQQPGQSNRDDMQI
jgi:hypothetical protein